MNNIGWLTYFPHVDLNLYEKHVFKMGWNSYGMVTEDCPHDPQTYKYECFE